MLITTSPRPGAPVPGPDVDDGLRRERRVLAARAAAEAALTYGDMASVQDLERFAQEAVNELWTGPLKVTAFVPILTLRRIHEKIEQTRPPVLTGAEIADVSPPLTGAKP